MKNFLPDITQIPLRSPFLKRKKSCPLSGENSPKIDYKDIKLLKNIYPKEERLFQVGLHLFLQKNNESYPRLLKELDFWHYYLIKWINHGSYFIRAYRKIRSNG